MREPDFFWGYLPFWIVNYGLAVLAWTCIGRFLLGLMIPANAPNYIMRAFVVLSRPALLVMRPLTPSYVGDAALPLLAAYWCFALRFVAYALFLGLGMVPRLAR